MKKLILSAVGIAAFLTSQMAFALDSKCATPANLSAFLGPLAALYGVSCRAYEVGLAPKANRSIASVPSSSQVPVHVYQGNIGRGLAVLPSTQVTPSENGGNGSSGTVISKDLTAD